MFRNSAGETERVIYGTFHPEVKWEPGSEYATSDMLHLDKQAVALEKQALSGSNRLLGFMASIVSQLPEMIEQSFERAREYRSNQLESQSERKVYDNEQELVMWLVLSDLSLRPEFKLLLGNTRLVLTSLHAQQRKTTERTKELKQLFQAYRVDQYAQAAQDDRPASLNNLKYLDLRMTELETLMDVVDARLRNSIREYEKFVTIGNALEKYDTDIWDDKFLAKPHKFIEQTVAHAEFFATAYVRCYQLAITSSQSPNARRGKREMEHAPFFNPSHYFGKRSSPDVDVIIEDVPESDEDAKAKWLQEEQKRLEEEQLGKIALDDIVDSRKRLSSTITNIENMLKSPAAVNGAALAFRPGFNRTEIKNRFLNLSPSSLFSLSSPPLSLSLSPSSPSLSYDEENEEQLQQHEDQDDDEVDDAAAAHPGIEFNVENVNRVESDYALVRSFIYRLHDKLFVEDLTAATFESIQRRRIALLEDETAMRDIYFYFQSAIKKTNKFFATSVIPCIDLLMQTDEDDHNADLFDFHYKTVLRGAYLLHDLSVLYHVIECLWAVMTPAQQEFLDEKRHYFDTKLPYREYADWSIQNLYSYIVPYCTQISERQTSFTYASYVAQVVLHDVWFSVVMMCTELVHRRYVMKTMMHEKGGHELVNDGTHGCKAIVELNLANVVAYLLGTVIDRALAGQMFQAFDLKKNQQYQRTVWYNKNSSIMLLKITSYLEAVAENSARYSPLVDISKCAGNYTVLMQRFFPNVAAAAAGGDEGSSSSSSSSNEIFNRFIAEFSAQKRDHWSATIRDYGSIGARFVAGVVASKLVASAIYHYIRDVIRKISRQVPLYLRDYTHPEVFMYFSDNFCMELPAVMSMVGADLQPSIMQLFQRPDARLSDYLWNVCNAARSVSNVWFANFVMGELPDLSDYASLITSSCNSDSFSSSSDPAVQTVEEPECFTVFVITGHATPTEAYVEGGVNAEVIGDLKHRRVIPYVVPFDVSSSNVTEAPKDLFDILVQNDAFMLSSPSPRNRSRGLIASERVRPMGTVLADNTIDSIVAQLVASCITSVITMIRQKQPDIPLLKMLITDIKYGYTQPIAQAPAVTSSHKHVRGLQDTPRTPPRRKADEAERVSPISSIYNKERAERELSQQQRQASGKMLTDKSYTIVSAVYLLRSDEDLRNLLHKQSKHIRRKVELARNKKQTIIKQVAQLWREDADRYNRNRTFFTRYNMFAHRNKFAVMESSSAASAARYLDNFMALDVMWLCDDPERLNAIMSAPVADINNLNHYEQPVFGLEGSRHQRRMFNLAGGLEMRLATMLKLQQNRQLFLSLGSGSPGAYSRYMRPLDTDPSHANSLQLLKELGTGQTEKINQLIKARINEQAAAHRRAVEREEDSTNSVSFSPNESDTTGARGSAFNFSNGLTTLRDVHRSAKYQDSYIDLWLYQLGLLTDQWDNVPLSDAYGNAVTGLHFNDRVLDWVFGLCWAILKFNIKTLETATGGDRLEFKPMTVDEAILRMKHSSDPLVEFIQRAARNTSDLDEPINLIARSIFLALKLHYKDDQDMRARIKADNSGIEDLVRLAGWFFERHYEIKSILALVLSLHQLGSNCFDNGCIDDKRADPDSVMIFYVAGFDLRRLSLDTLRHIALNTSDLSEASDQTSALPYNVVRQLENEMQQQLEHINDNKWSAGHTLDQSCNSLARTAGGYLRWKYLRQVVPFVVREEFFDFLNNARGVFDNRGETLRINLLAEWVQWCPSLDELSTAINQRDDRILGKLLERLTAVYVWSSSEVTQKQFTSQHQHQFISFLTVALQSLIQYYATVHQHNQHIVLSVAVQTTIAILLAGTESERHHQQQQQHQLKYKNTNFSNTNNLLLENVGQQIQQVVKLWHVISGLVRVYNYDASIGSGSESSSSSSSSSSYYSPPPSPPRYRSTRKTQKLGTLGSFDAAGIVNEMTNNISALSSVPLLGLYAPTLSAYALLGSVLCCCSMTHDARALRSAMQLVDIKPRQIKAALQQAFPDAKLRATKNDQFGNLGDLTMELVILSARYITQEIGTSKINARVIKRVVNMRLDNGREEPMSPMDEQTLWAGVVHLIYRAWKNIGIALHRTTHEKNLHFDLSALNASQMRPRFDNDELQYILQGMCTDRQPRHDKLQSLFPWLDEGARGKPSLVDYTEMHQNSYGMNYRGMTNTHEARIFTLGLLNTQLNNADPLLLSAAVALGVTVPGAGQVDESMRSPSLLATAMEGEALFPLKTCFDAIVQSSRGSSVSQLKMEAEYVQSQIKTVCDKMNDMERLVMSADSAAVAAHHSSTRFANVSEVVQRERPYFYMGSTMALGEVVRTALGQVVQASLNSGLLQEGSGMTNLTKHARGLVPFLENMTLYNECQNLFCKADHGSSSHENSMRNLPDSPNDYVRFIYRTTGKDAPELLPAAVDFVQMVALHLWEVNFMAAWTHWHRDLRAEGVSQAENRQDRLLAEVHRIRDDLVDFMESESASSQNDGTGLLELNMRSEFRRKMTEWIYSCNDRYSRTTALSMLATGSGHIGNGESQVYNQQLADAFEASLLLQYEETNFTRVSEANMPLARFQAAMAVCLGDTDVAMQIFDLQSLIMGSISYMMRSRDHFLLWFKRYASPDAFGAPMLSRYSALNDEELLEIDGDAVYNNANLYYNYIVACIESTEYGRRDIVARLFQQRQVRYEGIIGYMSPVVLSKQGWRQTVMDHFRHEYTQLQSWTAGLIGSMLSWIVRRCGPVADQNKHQPLLYTNGHAQLSPAVSQQFVSEWSSIRKLYQNVIKKQRGTDIIVETMLVNVLRLVLNSLSAHGACHIVAGVYGTALLNSNLLANAEALLVNVQSVVMLQDSGSGENAVARRMRFLDSMEQAASLGQRSGLAATVLTAGMNSKHSTRAPVSTAHRNLGLMSGYAQSLTSTPGEWKNKTLLRTRLLQMKQQLYYVSPASNIGDATALSMWHILYLGRHLMQDASLFEALTWSHLTLVQSEHLRLRESGHGKKFKAGRSGRSWLLRSRMDMQRRLFFDSVHVRHNSNVLGQDLDYAPLEPLVTPRSQSQSRPPPPPPVSEWRRESPAGMPPVGDRVYVPAPAGSTPLLFTPRIPQSPTPELSHFVPQPTESEASAAAAPLASIDSEQDEFDDEQRKIYSTDELNGEAEFIEDQLSQGSGAATTDSSNQGSSTPIPSAYQPMGTPSPDRLASSLANAGVSLSELPGQLKTPTTPLRADGYGISPRSSIRYLSMATGKASSEYANMSYSPISISSDSNSSSSSVENFMFQSPIVVNTDGLLFQLSEDEEEAISILASPPRNPAIIQNKQQLAAQARLEKQRLAASGPQVLDLAVRRNIYNLIARFALGKDTNLRSLSPGYYGGGGSSSSSPSSAASSPGSGDEGQVSNDEYENQLLRDYPGLKRDTSVRGKGHDNRERYFILRDQINRILQEQGSGLRIKLEDRVAAYIMRYQLFQLMHNLTPTTYSATSSGKKLKDAMQALDSTLTLALLNPDNHEALKRVSMHIQQLTSSKKAKGSAAPTTEATYAPPPITRPLTPSAARTEQPPSPVPKRKRANSGNAPKPRLTEEERQKARDDKQKQKDEEKARKAEAAAAKKAQAAAEKQRKLEAAAAKKAEKERLEEIEKEEKLQAAADKKAEKERLEEIEKEKKRQNQANLEAERKAKKDAKEAKRIEAEQQKKEKEAKLVKELAKALGSDDEKEEEETGAENIDEKSLDTYPTASGSSYSPTSTGSPGDNSILWRGAALEDENASPSSNSSFGSPLKKLSPGAASGTSSSPGGGQSPEVEVVEEEEQEDIDPGAVVP